jgi:hypothetical protein
MDLQEAAKKLATEKQRDNYMVLEFAYDTKILVPYKDGLSILAGLASAEKLNERYSNPVSLEEIPREAVNTRMVSYTEYQRLKMAELMGLTVEEVTTMMAEAKKPKQDLTP